MHCYLPFTLIYLISAVTCHLYHTTLKSGVLGRPGSNDAELYRTIADNLQKDDPNFCRLEFQPLNFNMSSGDAVFESLDYAREIFQNKNISVAIGPFIQVFASTDYVITQQLHLLTSPAGPNAAMMDPSKVFSILPEPSTVSAGIAALVKELGWSDVAFLAQDDFSPMLSLSQESIDVWPIRLPNFVKSSDDPELQRNLIALRQSEKDKFILHSNDRQMVLHVLQTAQKLHLLHRTKDWLITYLDFKDVTMGKHIPAWPGALFGLQLLHEDRLPASASAALDSLGLSMSRLDMGLAVDVVSLLRHILSIEGAGCKRARLANGLYIPAEALSWEIKNQTNPYNGALGRYVWDRSTNRRTEFTIGIMRYEGSNLTKIGNMTFDNDSPNITMGNVHFNGTREEFSFGEDYVLWVATKQTDPFVMKKGDDYVGFSHDLLHELAKKVKFRFDLFEVEDYTDANGNFINGMVQALTSGNASMAVGAMEVTSERQKVISFSYTILSSQASILIKKTRGHSSLFQFLAPFSTELWIMILLFINVASFSLYVMSRFDPTTQEGNLNRFDLKESLWYGWNIILQGTTDYSPSTTSMRAIIAFFWFCVVIIDAAYTANLAAFRTLQQIDDRIKNIHDLAMQTDLLYGVENGSDLMHFFQTRTEDPYERMWAYMKLNEPSVLLTNRTEIVEKVKQGHLAFIADGVTNDYYVKQHCGIESIEQTFGKKDFSLGFPRGAPYLDDINKALLQLKEEGVLDTLKEKWWMMGKNCTEEFDSRSIDEKATAELKLRNMTGVFFVLGFCVVLGIIVDIGERCYKRNTRRKKKKEEEEDKKKGEQREPLEMDGGTMENYYTFS